MIPKLAGLLVAIALLASIDLTLAACGKVGAMCSVLSLLLPRLQSLLSKFAGSPSQSTSNARCIPLAVVVVTYSSCCTSDRGDQGSRLRSGHMPRWLSIAYDAGHSATLRLVVGGRLAPSAGTALVGTTGDFLGTQAFVT